LPDNQAILEESIAMSDNVISIDQGRDNQTFVGSPRPQVNMGAAAATLPVVFAQVSDTPPHEAYSAPLSLQQLYPEQHDDSLQLKALNLIERARVTLLDALNFDPSANFLQFDQEIMRARALLLKAFMYRDIGEGYAAVVNAAIWALANRKPCLPSRRQINVISASLQRLISGPYIHFDTSMQILDDMEEADLDIEPPSLDILIEGFDD
jgi:hypothetical protein